MARAGNKLHAEVASLKAEVASLKAEVARIRAWWDAAGLLAQSAAWLAVGVAAHGASGGLKVFLDGLVKLLGRGLV
jgi:hypothetical protein